MTESFEPKNIGSFTETLTKQGSEAYTTKEQGDTFTRQRSLVQIQCRPIMFKSLLHKSLCRFFLMILVSLGKNLGKIQGGTDHKTPNNGVLRGCFLDNKKYACSPTTPYNQSYAILEVVQFPLHVVRQKFCLDRVGFYESAGSSHLTLSSRSRKILPIRPFVVPAKYSKSTILPCVRLPFTGGIV